MPKSDGPNPSRTPELALSTPALGQTLPLVRSPSASELLPPPSTARRRASPAGGTVGVTPQEPSAFERTHIWTQKSEVAAWFDRPLTVVTNLQRALFGETQRIVPTRPEPVDDTTVTQVFRAEPAPLPFDRNVAVKSPPRSGPRKSQQTQLIRPAAIIDLELPQVARGIVRDDLNKTQILSQATRPEPSAVQPAPRPMPHPPSGQTEHLPLSQVLDSFDLGVTHVLPVEDLIARRNRVQAGGEAAPPSKEPKRVEPLPRRVAEGLIGWWQKLPKLTRGAFALALFGALLWGANAEGGARPEVPKVPAVAVVAPIESNNVTTDAAREPGVDASASIGNSAPSPPIDPRSTMERAAVDASAEGRYEVAIRLYNALANAHPDNPVYREAARILLARTQPR